MLKKILKHRAVSAASLIAFLFALAGPVWAYFALRPAAGGPLILHFDDIQGIAVGPLRNLLFVGALGVIITILNFVIAFEFEERDQFFGKMLAAITLVMAVLLFISFAAIVNVN